ncbi:MAG: hypothetical protein U1D55_09335 [Phycisphaerae bacterium]
MSAIDRQVNTARRRLNLNIVMERLAFALLVATGLWTAALLADRLFDLHMPLWPSVGVAAGVAAFLTLVLAAIARIGRVGAAVAIDHAARLKERLSTAISIPAGQDEFVEAARRDAEKTAASLHVAQHLPYRAPRMWPWTVAGAAAAALFAAFMPQMNLLAARPDQTPPTAPVTKVEREAIKTAVSEQMERVKKLVEDKPELKDLASELEPLKMPDKPSATPEDVRREAVKQLSNVAEKLERQKKSDELASMRDLKRQLAQLDQQKNRDDQASKLQNDLASGDLESARDTLNEMKKQLEAAAKSDDPQAAEKLKELAKQTEALSKQIAELGDRKSLEKELENKAGLSAEDAKKLLDQVSKMDPKQLEEALQKQLADKGISQQQLQQIAQKIQQSQKAQQACKQLAQSLAQASKCMSQCQNPGDKPGNNAAAAQGAAALADAVQQLSQAEMAEQALNEIVAQIADLKDLKNQIGQGQCNGKLPGEPSDKIGNQGPQYGRGYGSRIGKEKAAHGMTPTRVRAPQTAGQIIGQQLIDGDQLRGEAQAQVRDAVNAAVRDATDAIEREAVPRQYERVTREYFEALAGLVGQKPALDQKTSEPKKP